MRSLDSRAAKFRVCVARTGPARELTHLAQIEAFRRAVSDSGLPAATDGRRSRPRPRLSFGPAISLGYESMAEYFDLELTAVRSTAQVASALGPALKEGFSLREVKRIPVFFPSLDASINVVEYEVRGPFPADAAGSVASFLARPEIVVEKVKEGGARVERVDARPLIREMSMEGPDRLRMVLRFGPKRTVKPEALIRLWLGLPQGAPGSELEGFRILRKELLSETARGELLKP